MSIVEIKNNTLCNVVLLDRETDVPVTWNRFEVHINVVHPARCEVCRWLSSSYPSLEAARVAFLQAVARFIEAGRAQVIVDCLRDRVTVA